MNGTDIVKDRVTGNTLFVPVVPTLPVDPTLICVGYVPTLICLGYVPSYRPRYYRILDIPVVVSTLNDLVVPIFGPYIRYCY